MFYQVEAGEVDVLLVVDNSTMAPYQDKLSPNFETFLTYFIEEVLIIESV